MKTKRLTTLIIYLGISLASIMLLSSTPNRAEHVTQIQTVPGVTTTASACWPTELPVGAIPGQPAPVFCSIVNSGPDTSTVSDNQFLDEFDHNLSFANFDNTAYRLFDDLRVYRSIHWRHANHWMVDVAPEGPEEAQANNAVGGAMVRPDRTFRFQDGVLRIDTEYAAGLPAYGAAAWGEIIITTADHPVYEGNPAGEPFRRDALYGYDMFPNHWALGCRLQTDGHTTCSLMENNTLGATEGGRRWEISFFQVEGETVMGGFSDGTYYRFCQQGDPDMECRDRFRLELTRTSLTIYANGVKYFEQTGLPPLPDELLNGELYIYLASIVNLAEADTVRFHWDHFAVNSPEPPSAAPSFAPPQPVELSQQFFLPLICGVARP